MELIFSTPVEVLQQRAKSEAEKTAFIYLENGEDESEHLTYADLDRQARQIAAALQQTSQAGERAMLIFPPGLDFVKTMYGCMYAGVIPIPTNPPTLVRSINRLYAIAKDSLASMVITTPELRVMFEQYSAMFPDLQPLRWLDTSMLTGDPQAWARPELRPEQTAFIQYTSGSTNLPKGVVISYRNLSYNRHVIREVRKHELTPESVTFHWVPLFHDMGLIAGVFQTVYDGSPSIMMSPIAFLQKPVRWLKGISKYRVTGSGGPNFAYELLINKATPADCEGLDLSSWVLAYNSAEPVRAETQARFSEKFKPYGFKPEAFFPCYGLAEATLLISAYGQASKTVTLPVERSALEEGKIVPFSGPDESNRQEIVSCGPPLLGVQAAIVNPNSLERCAPDQVGEIWVAGGNIGEGYWNNPAETEVNFRARIQGSDEGPFLRTGDLGFLHQGNLYVTGRQKDLIIVRGRNYYPQDIEVTVQKSHPGMRPGSGAAFAIDVDGTEHLAIVQEVRNADNDGQGWEAVLKKIRADIAREHGIRAHTLLLLEKGAVAKTSSGKIMRSECRNMFLNHEFKIVAEWRAPTH
jgi:acyl-CoA synthetase (AMP-forming)/AMP-acid ligase II